jgi:hypothetical protein
MDQQDGRRRCEEGFSGWIRMYGMEGSTGWEDEQRRI